MDQDFDNYEQASFAYMNSSSDQARYIFAPTGYHPESQSAPGYLQDEGDSEDENEDEDGEGEDENNTNIRNPLPFFSDPALRSAYSYGDPRGGAYPDPSLFRRDTTHDLESNIDYEALGPDNSFAQRSPAPVPIAPEGDSDSHESDPDVEVIQDDDVESDSDLDLDVDLEDRSRRGGTRGRGRGRGRPRGRGRGGRGLGVRGGSSTRGRKTPAKRRLAPTQGPTGPRKYKPKPMAEQTTEFKKFNAQATQAWMNEDWDEAMRNALEAIKINPEVFPLHGMVSEVLLKKGRLEDALSVLCVGAHSTREKEAWWHVVNTLLDIGPDTKETRQRLAECYSMLLDIDKQDHKAREGRMMNYLRSGQNTRAKNECLTLLNLRPHDTELLTHLAELCFILEEPATALPNYHEFVDYCLANEQPKNTLLDWQLLDFYVDLLIQEEQYTEALDRLRSISRWLLGRNKETYWDLQTDDREWDTEDEPRRIAVPEFRQGEHGPEAYGEGLMIELREKLGIIRLSLGTEHYEEAKVSIQRAGKRPELTC
jgi:general transcription factor 3C polypeptide 3 (transcription factor C subunit 4)